MNKLSIRIIKYADLPLGVEDSVLLEYFGDDRDGGVDGVGDDEDVGLGGDTGDGSGKVADDRRVGVEEVVTGHLDGGAARN